MPKPASVAHLLTDEELSELQELKRILQEYLIIHNRKPMKTSEQEQEGRKSILIPASKPIPIGHGMLQSSTNNYSSEVHYSMEIEKATLHPQSETSSLIDKHAQCLVASTSSSGYGSLTSSLNMHQV